MDFDLTPYSDSRFKSFSQQMRVSTERWAKANLYCPSCGSNLTPFPNNTRVYDFHCSSCLERFQLKSSTRPFSNQVLGAEYKTTLKSIEAEQQPSLILLHCLSYTRVVKDVRLVHRACITASCVIPRKPLSQAARRKGWQGCIISLKDIPRMGILDLVCNQDCVPMRDAVALWAKASSLLLIKPHLRGWLEDVLRCVEQLSSTFLLEDMYGFEDALLSKHPANHNVRPKIRQQLQKLRDLGIVKFS